MPGGQDDPCLRPGVIACGSCQWWKPSASKFPTVSACLRWTVRGGTMDLPCLTPFHGSLTGHRLVITSLADFPCQYAIQFSDDKLNFSCSANVYAHLMIPQVLLGKRHQFTAPSRSAWAARYLDPAGATQDMYPVADLLRAASEPGRQAPWTILSVTGGGIQRKGLN